MIQVVLRWNSERLYKLILDKKKEFTVGGGPKDEIQLPDLMPGMIKFVLKRDGLHIVAKKISDFSSGVLQSGTLLTRLSREVPLAVSWREYDPGEPKEYKLPYRGVVTIGRSEKNILTLAGETVSQHQMELRCEDGNVYLQDGSNIRASTNGTYVNGRRIKNTRLNSGDVIDLLQFRIRFENLKLVFEDAGNSFHRNADPAGSTNGCGERKHLRFYRTARQKEQLPTEPIVLQRPPTKGQRFEKQRGFFTSILSSGAMVGASVAMGAVSPALLAARAAGLISPVAGMFSTGKRNKLGQKHAEEYERKRQQKYGAYIESQRAIIQQTADKQRDIISRDNPSPRECEVRLQGLNITLWERAPKNPDFMSIRVGIGYEPLCVPIKAPLDTSGIQMENDEVELLAQEIIEENHIVDKVPTRVDLRQNRSCAVIGRRELVVSLVKNMLVTLTYEHFFREVKVVGIFDEEEKELWSSIRWLPHVWDAEGKTRYLAFDAAGAENLDEHFHELFRRTEQRDTTYYFFIIGSQHAAERLKLISDVLNESSNVNATILFACNMGDMSADEQQRYLNKDCSYIINLDYLSGPCCYDVEHTEKKVLFTPDPILSEDEFDGYCRMLSAVEVADGATQEEIPNCVTFLQGMQVDHVEELGAWARWSKPCKSGLRAPIGAMAGGKPFGLDVLNDGPHGLIAGTSGSGKSELMSSWLLSMALNYHPYDVAYVIIDYKGGGLANTLEGLPHMVGKITNLDGDVARSMVSLQSEITRRERLFEQLGINKHTDYMKGYYEGRYTEPLPHLLIIIDEFYELKTQVPEFNTLIKKITATGRSLGMNLVLATQNPTGVVDDLIRANMNFYISLRVTSVSASRDMLGTSDAAYLSQTGRAYIRIQSSDVYEQFQSYWSGAPYTENRAASVESENPVRVVEMNGKRIQTVKTEKKKDRSGRDELSAVVEYLARVAREHNLKKIACPWLPELPQRFQLADLKIPGAFAESEWMGSLPWLQVPIGRYDIPECQEQGNLYLDFNATGHYAIYGSGGTGKTTLLRTILCSLALWYRPDEISIYIIDCGSWSLKLFEQMPHVGGVALTVEEEKLAKIAETLTREINTRRKLFSQHGISSLKTYRETVADDLPAVFLVVDNLQSLLETAPSYTELLITLAKEGIGYGIYLVYTANGRSGIPMKMSNAVPGAVCFELADDTAYAEMVSGRRDSHRLVAGMRGRALLRRAEGPLLFQVALCLPAENEKEQAEGLKNLFAQMNYSWTGRRPARIPVMPEHIGLEELQAAYQDRAKLPVGYGIKSLEPACLDLIGGVALLVGSAGSGKSRTLTRLGRLLHSRDDNRLVILDSSRKGLSGLQDYGQYLCTTNAEGLASLVRETIQYLAGREAALKGKTAEEAAEFLQSEPLLWILIDDLSELMQSEDETMLKQLLSIIRYAKKLGAAILAAGRSEEIQREYVIDPIIGKLASAQCGLMLDGMAKSVTFLTNDLSFEEKTRALEDGQGMLYNAGKTEKIKRLDA